MAKLVSKTYGDALFELAVEKEILDETWDEVKALSCIWSENDELSNLLIHPRINKEEKITLIKNIFGERASDIMIGFLAILVEKGHAADLPSVLDYFSDRVREYKKIGVAYVSTALALSDEQKQSVEQRLLKVTKYVKFDMNYSVDSSLIGGVVIRIGDRLR